MLRRIVILGIFLSFAGIGTNKAYSQASGLTIKDCIQIALLNNSSVKNAERQFQLAGTNVTSARSNILPSISASLSPSRTFQSQRGPIIQDVPVVDQATGETQYVSQSIFQDEYYRNNFSSGVSINQTIFDGGRWWNQIKQSNAGYDGAELNFVNTKEQTVANVVQRYYELLKSQKLREVYEQAVESSAEQLKKTESMYELGAVAQADVYRSRVLLGQDQSNLILQRNTVNLNRNNLNIAMGREPGHPIELLSDDVDIDPLGESLEDLWAVVEASNPELHSLEADMKASQYGVRAAKANFLPQISFSARYSRFNTEFGQLYDPFDKNFSLSGSINISWNLFNGFADAAAVDRASLSHHINRENLINRRLTLRNELEQAYMSLHANMELEKINEDNVLSAEEDLRLNDERYRVGAGTLLEVIDARVALTRARATLISTSYNKLIYQVEIYSKLGNVEEKLNSILQ